MRHDGYIGRRDFLRTALIVGAAGATFGIAGCSPKDDTGTTAVSGAEVSWDEETDVVVVGYGGAGAAAAIEANQAGAQVVIFEKGNFAGGSTALCGQAIFGVNTRTQQEAGITDSVEGALAYFKCVGDGKEDMWLWLLENSGAAVDWLIDLGMEVPAKMGIPGLTVGGQEALFTDVTPIVARSHWSTGLWSVLQSTVEEAALDVRMQTPVTALITDPATGSVIGVKANDGSKDVLVKANKGVILAAGGFSRNARLKQDFVSQYETLSTAGLWDDGDGLNLAASVGASLGWFGLNCSPNWTDPPRPCNFMITGVDEFGFEASWITVNEAGKRFTNERAFYALTGMDILNQTGGHAWVLAGGPNAVQGIEHNTSGVSPLNNMVTGETLADIADALGIDPAALESTVAEWNQFCENGTDAAFGRPSELYPFAEGPYAAAEVMCGEGSTFGGANINTDCEALSALTDEPIPGLYVAGVNNTALGRFYTCCGSAVMQAIVTGRIAGINAAAR